MQRTRVQVAVAAAWEAGLLTLAALLGWWLRAPLIFTSLGPTAYEMIATPERQSARVYNVLVGHGVGIASGLLAVAVTDAWRTPALSVNQGLPLDRVWTVLLASLLTVLGTLLLKAAQPSALSTSLLIALGTLQSMRGVLCLAAGVLLITAAAEPVRRHKLEDEGEKP